MKTLLARLRAFEAVERASFALTTLDALMEPFERHRIRIDMAGDTRILSAGECVAEMIPAGLEGAPVTLLLRDQDRDFLRRLLASLMVEEMGCHFGATAVTPASVPVALEGLILPEPPLSLYAPVTHISICLIRSDYPGDRPQTGPLSPLTLGPTRFITLENRGADRVLLYKPRWPRSHSWTEQA